ncbi:WD40 repeat-like protein [Pluteus cervinus]|uniref:WD40 repeat-like protein n=1 Tax=Pluteus cervinus TaxID=181527 RepID=A0ACD3AKY8_9AGAR|nr:WD40 repeat-like protein [Pluteus cervinus]
MVQKPTERIQSGDAPHFDSPQLHIIALNMEHKNSFIHKFIAGISVSNGTNPAKEYESAKEGVKRGKVQWRLNVPVPVASKIVVKILKHHTFQKDEIITTVSVPFPDILKFFQDNQQNSMMDIKGQQGEKLSLSIEQKSIQDMLQRVTLPSAVLEKLGYARQPVEVLIAMSDQLGDVNSIAKVVLGLFSKVYEQLEKQELCIQQVSLLFEKINLLAPLLATAQELEEYEHLQKVIVDILHLFQDVLNAIDKYNESHLMGQILDQFKSDPSLDIQRFSTRFENLSKAFDQSLQVDQAQMLDQAQVESILSKLKPDFRQPAAFCAQDTCSDIFIELDRWAMTQSEKLFWLHGVAGMGKSTIAATYSNRLKAQKMLGGYHICSRDTTVHQSSTQLVLNLCYQLSLAHKPFGRLVAKTIKADSLFSPNGMPVTELFELLILQSVKTLKDKHPGSGKIILIIDALDECGDARERQSVIQKSEELVGCCEWIKVLLTSRPAVNVQKTLSKEKLAIWSLDPRNNNQNIQKFLKVQFQSNPEFKSDLDQLLRAIPILTKQSGGLFIWAKAACEYLDSGIAISEGLEKLLHNEAHHNLYFVYNTALSQAFATDTEICQTVLSTIILAGEQLSEKALVGLLSEQTESMIQKILLKLKTLLYLGTDKQLYIIHPSLREYLTDPQVCPAEFYIAKDQHYMLFEKTIQVMHKQVRFNICNIESSYETNEEITGLQERISQNISEELKYSSRYWMYHMVNSGDWSLSHDHVVELLESENGWLYWVEVLSLLGIVRETMLDMTKAIQWIKEESNCQRKIEEITTFLSRFVTPISQSACHIYISALPFVPEKSWMAKQFWNGFINSVIIRNIKGQNWREIQSYTRILKGHTQWIRSVAYSSDNRYVVSGSNDKTVRIWDVETGQQKGTELTGHTHYVTSVAFSSDSRYVVSGSQDNTVRIWDVETGKQKGTEFKGHTKWVESVAFSSDSKYVVSGSLDNTVRIWDVETGQQKRPFKGHTSGVRSVAISSHNKYVVSGAQDNTVRIWDVETGLQKGEELEGHTSYITSVAFSPDNKYVASGSEDNTVRIWDVETAQQKTEFQGHTKQVTSVSFSNDSRYVVSGSWDSTIRIWDMETGQQKGAEFRSHTDPVTSVAFSTDMQSVVSGSIDQTVRIQDVGTGKGTEFQGHTKLVTSVALSTDMKYAVSGSEDKTVRVWDMQTGQLKITFQGHVYTITSVAFSSDTKYVVSGSNDHTIRIWDMETGQQKGNPITGHTNWVTSVAFSSDNRYVVSGSHDRSVRIWDVETGHQKGVKFEVSGSWITTVSFSSDNKYVVSKSHDNIVRIWDVETGEETNSPLQSHLQSLVSSSSDEYSVSKDDTTIRLYSLQQNNTILPPLVFSDTTFSTLTSPSPQFQSSLLVDGWYYVNGHRYLWIPPLYRQAISASQFRCFPFSAENPTLFANLDKFVHGPNWTSVMTSA